MTTEPLDEHQADDETAVLTPVVEDETPDVDDEDTGDALALPPLDDGIDHVMPMTPDAFGPEECIWLICDGYGNPDPRAHHRDCPGHRKVAGWRARIPLPQVIDEVARIKAGRCDDTPTFRGLAVEHAIAARFGEEIAS